jgi:tetratricopeptide (TPR) repeat protein
LVLGHLYTAQHRFTEAREVLDRRDRLPSAREAALPRALLEAATGNKPRALELAKTLPAVGRARVYLALGDYDTAFRALERAIEDRTFLAAQWSDPDLDPVRSDPRFARLVERMGLPAGPLTVWGTWPADQ